MFKISQATFSLRVCKCSPPRQFYSQSFPRPFVPRGLGRGLFLGDFFPGLRRTEPDQVPSRRGGSSTAPNETGRIPPNDTWRIPPKACRGQVWRQEGKTERQDARGRSHLLGVDQARCNNHGGHAPYCGKVPRRLTEGLKVLIVNKKRCAYLALNFCLLSCRFALKPDSPASFVSKQAVSNGLVR